MTTIMLAGDVMLGRGIDQILRHPSPPVLYEPWVKSALDYVALAERKSGEIPRRVPFSYVWGDALEEFCRAPPEARVINLETAVTCCATPEPKGIHYRCNPANLPCVAAASIDCCVLANNHVLDWGRDGLMETLTALARAGLKTAGAGRNRDEAEAPAILPLPEGRRALVYAFATSSSGVPPTWAAAGDRPGVNFLDLDADGWTERFAERLARDRKPGDIVIASIHWGPNWGYGVADSERRFAHKLIDEAGVDIVHGHSSHHPKPVEIHRRRPIFYGCGDLINDYEGIGGEEAYRPDLALLYLVSIAPDGCCCVEMLPYRIARFRLYRATRGEAEWLAARLDRECRPFGSRVSLKDRPTMDGGMGFALELG